MLSDDKIYLRRLERSDLDRTHQWLHEPSVYSNIGVQVPFSKSAQERWFDETDQSRDKVVFAICLKDGDRHVGNVSLDSIDYRHRNARLSIFIGDVSLRRGGIGSRALRLLARYAFDFLNLHKIWCKTTVGNEAVVRFYEAVGFQTEGCLREHEFVGGRYIDKVVLGLLRKGFEE